AAYVAKKLIRDMIKGGTNILEAKDLVMGTTFKENVSDIRNSKVADVVKELKDYCINVHVTDPYAEHDELMHEYGYGLNEIEKDYDAVIVAVNHDEYVRHDEDYFKSIAKDKAIFVDIKGV